MAPFSARSAGRATAIAVTYDANQPFYLMPNHLKSTLSESTRIGIPTKAESLLRGRILDLAYQAWSSLLTTIRSELKPLKRILLGQRPFGLAEVGPETLVQRPRFFSGKQYIHVGDRCFIKSHSYIQVISNGLARESTPRIEIGDDVYIGRYSYLTAINRISIGSGSVLSEHVYITDLSHGFSPPDGRIMEQPLLSNGPVDIGPNCFLGYRSCVMPGVNLGEWCIIGANSVVTRSFPSYSMIAGAPARIRKVYSHSVGQWVSPADLDRRND